MNDGFIPVEDLVIERKKDFGVCFEPKGEEPVEIDMEDKGFMNLGLTCEEWKVVDELFARANKEQIKIIKEMAEEKLEGY